MGQHARLAPSGDDKWMTCSGSIAMEAGRPPQNSDYTDEGTAAHFLASESASNKVDPITYRGEDILVGTLGEDFDGAVWASKRPEGFILRRRYTVTEEMAGYVNVYLTNVRNAIGPQGIALFEQRLPIEKFTGEEGAHGTSDVVGFLPDELQVHDLKYGMGIQVFAEQNRQLMKYMLAAREEYRDLFGPFKQYRLVVHQPRLDHLDEWVCTDAELDAYAEQSRSQAKHVIKLYRQWGNEPERTRGSVLDNLGVLTPSEKGCRWCKARGDCVALDREVQAIAGIGFVAMDEENMTVKPGQYTPAELSLKLSKVPLLELLASGLRADAERVIFAGGTVPDWKLVEGKKGHRKYTNKKAAAEFLKKKLRLKDDDMYDKDLKSPTQIEKVLGKGSKAWLRLVEEVGIEQSPGRPSIAPVSDKRAVYVAPDKAEGFIAVDETADSIM